MGPRARRRTDSGSAALADRTAVVIGASMAGLFIAAALARHGFAVTVLERDQLPVGPQNRRGVPQDTQAHVLLYRGIMVIEDLLPGFRADLLAAGAVAYDSGRMPWLGEYGWLDTEHSGYEVLSATRPLMEAVARHRVAGLAGVQFRDGVTVTGLTRTTDGWHTRIETEARNHTATDAGAETDSPRAEDVVTSRLVIDASGRSSRLSRWSVVPQSPSEEHVDAQVGYASRLYRERRPVPVRTGVMIFASIDGGTAGTAGLAVPVEHRHWLVAAAGFGGRRPPRDDGGFQRFLADLRDPAIADLVALLEPVSDVSIHRQTANQRRRWDRIADWPAGLLVVGDALCSLNPVYGQGITVAAQQAQLLGRALQRGRPVDHALQRRMVAVTDVPWSIATTADLRQPTCPAEPTAAQRISIAWVARLSRLAAAGDERASAAIVSVNNLMASPASLLRPALLVAGCRSLPTKRLPRPTALEELSHLRRELPPADPAAV